MEANDILISPETREPLKRRKDGFYEAENDDKLYVLVDDKLIALTTPNGKPMKPVDKGQGIFYSEQEGVYYKFSKFDLVPLVSPIDGTPLVPLSDGTFDSTADDLVYEFHDGKVVALLTPDNLPIVNNGDGTYSCEGDGKLYEITPSGRINSVTAEELARRESFESRMIEEENNVAMDEEPKLNEHNIDNENFKIADGYIEENNTNDIKEDNLYGYDNKAAAYWLNGYVLGDISRESIEEALDSLGLPYRDELFSKLDEAKNNFQSYMDNLPPIMVDIPVKEDKTIDEKSSTGDEAVPADEVTADKADEVKTDDKIMISDAVEVATDDKATINDSAKIATDEKVISSEAVEAITDGKVITKDTDEVTTGDVDKVKEIEEKFSNYNTPAFMNPVTAYRLNREYRDLTGEDNPKFLEDTPEVIATLKHNEKSLLKNGAYDSRFFAALNDIGEYVKLRETINYEKSRGMSAA